MQTKGKHQDAVAEFYPLFGQDDAGTVTLKNVPISACLPPVVLAQLSPGVLAATRVKIKFYNTIYHVLRSRLPVRVKNVRITSLVCMCVCVCVLV